MSRAPGSIYFSDSGSSSLSTSFADETVQDAHDEAPIPAVSLVPFQDGGLALLHAAPGTSLLPADVERCLQQLQDGQTPWKEHAQLSSPGGGGGTWRLVTVLRTDVVGGTAYCWATDSGTAAVLFASSFSTTAAAGLRLSQASTASSLYLVPRAELVCLPASLEREQVEEAAFMSDVPMSDATCAEGLLCCTLRTQRTAGRPWSGLLSITSREIEREVLLTTGTAVVMEAPSLQRAQRLLAPQLKEKEEQGQGREWPIQSSEKERRGVLIFTGEDAVPQLLSFLRAACSSTEDCMCSKVRSAAEVLRALLPSHAPIPLYMRCTAGPSGLPHGGLYVDASVAEDSFWQLLAAAPQATLEAPVLILLAECCTFHDQNIQRVLQDLVLPLQAQHAGMRDWASTLVCAGFSASDVSHIVRLCGGLFFFIRVRQIALSDDGEVLLEPDVQPYWDLAVFLWCTADTSFDNRGGFDSARQSFMHLVAAALQPCGTVSFQQFQRTLVSYLYACLLSRVVQHLNREQRQPEEEESREVHLFALPTGHALLPTGRHRAAPHIFSELTDVLLEDLWSSLLVEPLIEEAGQEGVSCSAVRAPAAERLSALAKERDNRQQRLALEAATWARQLPRFRLCERLGSAFPHKAISLFASVEPVQGEKGLRGSALWERVRSVAQLPQTRLMVLHTLLPATMTDRAGSQDDRGLLIHLQQVGLWHPFLCAGLSLCNVFPFAHFAVSCARSAIWYHVFSRGSVTADRQEKRGGEKQCQDLSFAVSQLPEVRQSLYRTAVAFYRSANYRLLAQLVKEAVPCCEEVQIGAGSVFVSGALLHKLRADEKALRMEAAACLRRVVHGLSARLAVAKLRSVAQQVTVDPQRLLSNSWASPSLRAGGEAEREKLLRETSATRAEDLAARSRRVGSNGLTLQKEWAATVTLLHAELRAALREMHHYEDERARVEQQHVEIARKQAQFFEKALTRGHIASQTPPHPFGSSKTTREDLWNRPKEDTDTQRAAREGRQTAQKTLRLVSEAARLRSAQDSRLLALGEARQLQRHLNAQNNKWRARQTAKDATKGAPPSHHHQQQQHMNAVEARLKSNIPCDSADGLVHSHVRGRPSVRAGSASDSGVSSVASPLPWQTKQDLQSLWEMSNIT